MNIGDITSKVDRFIAEKISPIDKKIIAVVCILTFIIPAGAAYYFFINPKVVEITKLKSKREHLNQEIALAKKKAAELDKFEAELADVKKTFEEIKKLLPKAKEIPNLLRAISDMGQNAGLDFLLFKPGTETKQSDASGGDSFYAEIPLNVNVSGPDFLSFKPGKETPKDFYAEIPVDISIRGPYHNMGYFLDQISKLDRIVTISDVKLGGSKEERGEIMLQTTCNMKTYKQL